MHALCYIFQALSNNTFCIHHTLCDAYKLVKLSHKFVFRLINSLFFFSIFVRRKIRFSGRQVTFGESRYVGLVIGYGRTQKSRRLLGVYVCLGVTMSTAKSFLVGFHLIHCSGVIQCVELGLWLPYTALVIAVGLMYDTVHTVVSSVVRILSPISLYTRFCTRF